MSNLAIVKSQEVSGSLTINSMDDLARLAEMMSKSGFFDDCKQAAQAGVKIMCGIELGIGAFAAMSGIHLIKGKPAIGANVMAAMIKRSGKYNYRILEHTEQICRIAFFEGKDQIGVSEFSAADAQRMGTQNMNKFPKNMLFARCISNGIKFHCPDLFLGSPVYTPEELGAQVNEDGEVIQTEARPVAVEVVDIDYRFAAERLRQIEERTGHTPADVMSIAQKQKPVIDPDRMSDSDCDRLRNSLYAAWGADIPGAFKAPKHAWNAYQQLLKDLEPEAGDQEIWEAWEAVVFERASAAQKPEVTEDEF